MLASSKKAVADAAVMRRALEEGAKSWNRSKVMLVGQWEAGKTYLADAMMGNEFSDNTRTRGINKFSLDVNFAQVDAGVWKVNTSQHQGNHHLEHAVAELIRVKKKQNISAPARKVVKADGVPMAAENSIFTSLLSYFRFFGQSESSASAAATTGMVSSISLQPHQVDRVSKLLSSNTRMGDIVVALYDFGGQEIFSSIYPLFFTRNAVYLVVFDLRWLADSKSPEERSQCLEYLSYWVNTIAVHTQEDGYITAKFAVVGTHRLNLESQYVSAEAFLVKLKQISALMEPMLSKWWGNLIKDSTGDSELCFFAIDSAPRPVEMAVRSLMEAIEEAIKESNFVTAKRPFTWFRALDLLLENPRKWLPLEESRRLAILGGVREDDVEQWLQFLHDMGIVMWHNEQSLKDVVVKDPEVFFVEPVTRVICVQGVHHCEFRVECNGSHLHEDFQTMLRTGIVSMELLRGLLRDLEPLHVDMVIGLLRKYSLAEPWKRLQQTVGNSSAVVAEADTITQYFSCPTANGSCSFDVNEMST
jgi:GTPase SAR1 family protein